MSTQNTAPGKPKKNAKIFLFGCLGVFVFTILMIVGFVYFISKVWQENQAEINRLNNLPSISGQIEARPPVVPPFSEDPAAALILEVTTYNSYATKGTRSLPTKYFIFPDQWFFKSDNKVLPILNKPKWMPPSAFLTGKVKYFYSGAKIPEKLRGLNSDIDCLIDALNKIACSQWGTLNTVTGLEVKEYFIPMNKDVTIKGNLQNDGITLLE